MLTLVELKLSRFPSLVQLCETFAAGFCAGHKISSQYSTKGLFKDLCSATFAAAFCFPGNSIPTLGQSVS